MREAQELSQPTAEYHAQPTDDNLFEWHFTVRGPSDSDFEGGIYHGRIILPPEYPLKPPSIMLLTVSLLLCDTLFNLPFLNYSLVSSTRVSI
jgi:ubiquitin-conjugating enzyme E2 J1